MSTKNKVPDDTRQALHLSLVEENTLWLDDEPSEPEPAFGADPFEIASHREEELGRNYFGQDIH